jgi:hypothetical protein
MLERVDDYLSVSAKSGADFLNPKLRSAGIHCKMVKSCIVIEQWS